jgi:hypothetical protein
MATRHYTMQVGICNSRHSTERARHPYVVAVSRGTLGRYCRLGLGKVNENPDGNRLALAGNERLDSGPNLRRWLPRFGRVVVVAGTAGGAVSGRCMLMSLGPL